MNTFNDADEVMVPLVGISDEDIDAALSVIEDDDYRIGSDTRLFWRRYPSKKRIHDGITTMQPGDLHYFKNCVKILGTSKQQRSYWRKRIEGMYLIRRFVQQYICRRCAIKQEKANLTISNHFLRVSSKELAWTENEESEKRKQLIERLGIHEPSIEVDSETQPLEST